MDLPRARGVGLVIFADGRNRADKTRAAGCLGIKETDEENQGESQGTGGKFAEP